MEYVITDRYPQPVHVNVISYERVGQAREWRRLTYQCRVHRGFRCSTCVCVDHTAQDTAFVRFVAAAVFGNSFNSQMQPFNDTAIEQPCGNFKKVSYVKCPVVLGPHFIEAVRPRMLLDVLCDRTAKLPTTFHQAQRATLSQQNQVHELAHALI